MNEFRLDSNFIARSISWHEKLNQVIFEQSSNSSPIFLINGGICIRESIEKNHLFGNISAGLPVMKHAHNEPQMFVICIRVIVLFSLKISAIRISSFENTMLVPGVMQQLTSETS